MSEEQLEFSFDGRAPPEQMIFLTLGPLCAVKSLLPSPLTLNPPLKVKGNEPLKGSKGALSRHKEEEILREIACIVGTTAMRKNGGGWRARIRSDCKAVLFAIEDFKVRTFEQRTAIVNRDGWLADRFFRARQEIDQVWRTG